MDISIEDAFFYGERRASLMERLSQEDTRRQLSHLSQEDMEDELVLLLEHPAGTQPLQWDSEVSVLVHSAINGIENTLQARRTRSGHPHSSPSRALAGVGRILTFLHRGKVDKPERKRFVSFEGMETPSSSSCETACAAVDTVSMCAASVCLAVSSRKNVFRQRRSSNTVMPYFFARTV